MAVLVKGESGFETEAEIAGSFLKRMLGLMFIPGLPEGKALILSPCSGVHTCFMRFAIDVVYLDRNYVVVKKETLFPWRIGRFVKGAGSVMELNRNAAGKLQVGDRLEIVKAV
ncbi:DUF192 domain-containing protein [Lachnospiraceae bacterium 54-53]